MSFDKFIKTGKADYAFGDSFDSAVKKMKSPNILEVDGNSGSWAAYDNGIEYLFEDGKLWLTQYDPHRCQNLLINNHIINENTHLENFKKYLLEINIHYSETKSNRQRILTTSTGVKIYFDEDSKLFLTAMKSWRDLA